MILCLSNEWQQQTPAEMDLRSLCFNQKQLLAKYMGKRLGWVKSPLNLS